MTIGNASPERVLQMIKRSNSELMASARTLVPALAAEVEALVAENEGLRREYSKATGLVMAMRSYINTYSARADAVEKRVAELEAALADIGDLIDESSGVYGLHKNGDPSPWNELLEGGEFECWLKSVSIALTTEGPDHAQP